MSAAGDSPNEMSSSTSRSPEKRRSSAKFCVGAPRPESASRVDGPDNLDDLVDWPARVVMSFLVQQGSFDRAWEHRRARLQGMLGRGLVLHTSYSGIGSPEVALRMLGIAFAECGLALATGDGARNDFSDWLVSWSACDYAKPCQTAMLGPWAPLRLRPEHFFGSMLSKVPLAFQKQIVSKRPPASSSKDERTHCFSEMSRFISQNGPKLFDRDATAACLLHPDKPSGCSLTWQGPSGASPSERLVTAVVAGATCTPWCSSGARMGYSDDATEPYMLWLEEMKQTRPDLVFFENSPNFPIGDLASSLPHAHTVDLIFGPEDLGWPVRRRRLMSCSIGRETMVWLGPMTAEVVKEDFASFFFVEGVLDASIFVGIDSPSAIRARRASLGGRRPGVQVDDSMPIAELVGTPKIAQRVKDYEQLAMQKSVGAGSMLGLCVDISQSAQRPRYGRDIPSLQRSSTMVWLEPPDFIQGHVYTPRELAIAHGWPVSPPTVCMGVDKYANCNHMQDFGTSGDGCDRTGALSMPAILTCLGNCMHLHSVGAWMTYIMANTMRRCVVKEYLPPLRLLEFAVPCDVSQPQCAPVIGAASPEPSEPGPEPDGQLGQPHAGDF